MGTGRTFKKAPRTRPKKSPLERKRREKVQQKRLVALGMDAEVVRKMTSKGVRDLLKAPKKTEAAIRSRSG